MNKNFALFLGLVVGIVIFAIVVMIHVPRRIADVDGASVTTSVTGDYSLVRTEPGFSEQPDGRDGINVKAIAG